MLIHYAIVLIFVTLFVIFCFWLTAPIRTWVRGALSFHPNQVRSVEKNKSSTVRWLRPSDLTRAFSDVKLVDLSVVIPAYNESLRIGPCLTEMINVLQGKNRESGFTYELIVVNDGSKDATNQQVIKVAETLKEENVLILDLKENRGKGFAVAMGMHCIAGKYALMADADGATKFDEIDKLLYAIEKPINSKLRHRQNKEEKSESVVFGSRKHLETSTAVVQRSIFRNILMWGFHFYVSCLLGITIGDTQCGFKLFSRNVVRRIFPKLHLARWSFDIEIVTICNQLGLTIHEVPVEWTEVEGSKLSPILAAFDMARDILIIRVLYATRLWSAAEEGNDILD